MSFTTEFRCEQCGNPTDGLKACGLIDCPWPTKATLTADAQEATPRTESVISRITTYLSGGGLFNPELANHDKVRDLLIDCRDELSLLRARLEAPCPDIQHLPIMDKNREQFTTAMMCVTMEQGANCIRDLAYRLAVATDGLKVYGEALTNTTTRAEAAERALREAQTALAEAKRDAIAQYARMSVDLEQSKIALTAARSERDRAAADAKRYEARKRDEFARLTHDLPDGHTTRPEPFDASYDAHSDAIIAKRARAAENGGEK